MSQEKLSEDRDDVVLVDEAGQPIGSAERLEVHTNTTPLHLAFSTYLFNERGELLITRRALTKKTWPGVWTNSCCGHPQPGEELQSAARRRIREELGASVGQLSVILPDFRYQAVDANGMVENEVCPVFMALVAATQLAPHPSEVAEIAWVDWEKFVTAVTATPHVYSPWVALQVPLMAAHHPRLVSTPSRPAPTQQPEAMVDAIDIASVIADVDGLLQTEIEALLPQWQQYTGDLTLDILPRDLPQWLATLLVGQGKRLRVMLAYCGFIAAGGAPGSIEYHHLVRAAAALETLHLFALIHDDVMDESDSRRGRATAHIEAAGWHYAAQGYGGTELFGRNIAILLGDLTHTLADRLIDSLPPAMRAIWYELSMELIAGQRADLTGAAAGRRDRAHAEHVATIKSGRYTISRPLQLGATAAGAPQAMVKTLMEYGDLLGHAFALRDDYLGVWGDPDITGKPVGDDLLEAKATVLLSLARERLHGSAAQLLASVGKPTFRPHDVHTLADAMRAAGVDAEVEHRIAQAVTAALAALDSQPLTPQGIAGLRDAAHAVAWRNA